MNNQHVAVTFDLQQVLTAPQLEVISLFYKRKLNCYNLTVYNLATAEVKCYMWHEGSAGRGSDEIATCILDYITALPPTTTDVHMFSDTCGGQNRNIQMSTTLLWACEKLDNIERIHQ